MTVNANARTALKLGLIAGCMVGLSFASVPFYDWFCRVTGFGGETQVAAGDSTVVLDREITVRFDASIEAGMGWKFEPETKEVTLRIGETGIAFYRATNITDAPIAGTASYNVTPFSAGGYFAKIDCFCFVEQVLLPGESVLMPVTFFVDPEIVEDREAKYLDSITLSYQFFRKDLPEGFEMPAEETGEPEDTGEAAEAAPGEAAGESTGESGARAALDGSLDGGNTTN